MGMQKLRPGIFGETCAKVLHVETAPLELAHRIGQNGERGMEALMPSSIDSSQERGIAGARYRSAALQSAVRLLGEAGRALRNNQDEADACIAKAAALLQAESDLADRSAGMSSQPYRGRLAPWQVTRVVRFIDANLPNKIGVRDFAAVARLSSCHFARAFRGSVGETPYAYLIRRRIERVQELILATNKSLAEIALDCGMGDQARMTRHFRRIAGLSPGAWRRAHGAAARDGAALLRVGALDAAP
jgi:AraC family transcriptional regulator